MKRDPRHIPARASWCHARARVAELLDEKLTAEEQQLARELAGVVELEPATVFFGDELARRYVLHLAREHARTGRA